MDRSLRPFSLTWVALALVIWAGLGELGRSAPPPPAPPAEQDFVPRRTFTVTGDALGPGVDWPDLARAELARAEDGQVIGLRLEHLLEPAWRLGLEEGDLVWAIDGKRVDDHLASVTRVLPRQGERWCYQVLRDGAPLELCYHLREPGSGQLELGDGDAQRRWDAIAARVKVRRLERDARLRAGAHAPEPSR